MKLQVLFSQLFSQCSTLIKDSQKVKILFVFDSSLMIRKSELLSFNSNDTVYLFSLTSKVGITTDLVKNIKNTGCKVEILHTAKMINLAADNLRGKYIKFIAELPKRVQNKGKNLRKFFAIDRHTTLWWFSLIAQKNTFKSDAFNKLVQFDSIVRIIKQENIDKIIFGCRSKKLQNALSEYSQENSIKLEFLPIKQIRNLMVIIQEAQKIFYFKHILLLFLFAGHSFVRTWKIKKKLGNLNQRQSINTNDTLMIITYYPNIDIESAKDGIFKNKYYIHLQESLESKGKDVVWVAIYVHNNYISFEESLRYAEKFIKNGHVIFFLEEFNSIIIQLKTFLTMLISSIKFIRIEKKVRELHTFDDYNFYQLFKDDWYSSFVGYTGFNSIVNYRMFKSLLDRVKAGKCLYYCEMHGWEKALLSAKNAIGSKISLLGYQHATVSKMLLNYFNDPSEMTGKGSFALPQPDKLICNGQLSLSYMKESGWPEEKLIKAEAIRYDHLKKYARSKWIKKRDIVLLAFSISPEESSSLLNIVYDSLKNLKNIEVWVKPHPFLRIEKVFELSGISIGTFTFQIKNSSIEQLFSEAKIVIVGESGVSIEAVAFGCKIIVVN